MRLSKSFFNRDTNIVAQELLGKVIVVKNSSKETRAIITETEAYHGFEDRASHASRKKTERNKIMFDKAGLVYVYLIYGMHHCLNVVTMPKNYPAAVLIRAVSPELNTKYLIHNTCINGPGRVTKYLGIDKTFYGEDLSVSKRIWIESVGAGSSRPNKACDIIKSKRIGVDYAGECADWLWNYKIRIES
jgi:DNA-3-methyladenine glycosylase